MSTVLGSPLELQQSFELAHGTATVFGRDAAISDSGPTNSTRHEYNSRIYRAWVLEQRERVARELERIGQGRRPRRAPVRHARYASLPRCSDPQWAAYVDATGFVPRTIVGYLRSIGVTDPARLERASLEWGGKGDAS